MTFLRAITIVLLIWLFFDSKPVISLTVYVLIGVQVIAWLWPRIAGQQIEWRRQAPLVVSPNEPGEITITITYRGHLPLPYLVITEDIPPALSTDARKRWVISLKPGQQQVLRYTIQSRQRGLYWLGPLRISIGAVLDLNEVQLVEQQQTPVTIIPSVVPLPLLALPAGLPFSHERQRLSLFDDPAQKMGVRPYRPGDSPRRMDWKTSARLGELQVRELAPVIARETLIALEFSETAYRGRFARDNRERAVIAAASLATALMNRRQAVGLCSNGYDPLTDDRIAPLPPAAELEHLREILARLGRIEPERSSPFLTDLIAADRYLSWGGTLMIITAALDERWLVDLTTLSQSGLRIAVALAEPGPTDILLARRYGLTAYRIDRTGAIVPEA
ncbi:DUF58 domain-containing protein [uncultured Chloroflexus sp.]|uniref:DUF58 domain-containing protein n=1 Tax=uncultured Chloroflexus sp. TaxID=214040 RepID=UPI0026114E50|nr:DUF58 domain-containing protein [uncultured Chloroflexus sp.]